MWAYIAGGSLMLSAILQDPRGKSPAPGVMFLIGAAFLVLAVSR